MTGLSGVTLGKDIQFQVRGLLVVGKCTGGNKFVGELELITLFHCDVVQKDIYVVRVDVDSQRQYDGLNTFVLCEYTACPSAHCVFYLNTMSANTQNFLSVIVLGEDKGKVS